jgi:hypothetical protein
VRSFNNGSVAVAVANIELETIINVASSRFCRSETIVLNILKKPRPIKR